ELKPKGRLAATSGTVSVTSTLASGRPGASLSFTADLDDEGDLYGASTYTFTHDQAEALIGLAKLAKTLTVTVDPVGTISVFKPAGGMGSWSRIGCKF